MPVVMISGPTILKGNFISSPIAVSSPKNSVMAIIMPPAWDSAPVTFQWSNDNNNFFDLFNVDGMEVSYIGEPAGVMIPLNLPLSGCTFPYVKFRSGPRASPVPQSADRVFTIVAQ